MIARTLRWARLAAALVLLIAGAGDAMARFEGNLNLFVGAKRLNAADWEPLEVQREFGLMLAFGEERAKIHFAVDAFLAKDDVEGTQAPDALIGASSLEGAFGVRKVWNLGATRPHAGAGAVVVHVSEDRNGPFGPVTYDDRGYGVWVDGGVTWRLASHLNLGIEARFSSVRAVLGSGTAPREVVAGGVHLGLLVGYGW